MKESISIPCADTAVSAYLSLPNPNGTFPALIVIEEIWGLNDHIKDVCDRFAQEGFAVLSPELLGEDGILEKISLELSKDMRSDDPAIKHAAQAKMREATAPISTKEFSERTIAKLHACVDYLLARDYVNGNAGVLGFCFGGTYAYALGAHDPRIKAVVPFYGQPLEPLNDVEKINAPILAFYGEQDERLVSKLPDLVEAMKYHGRDFSYMRYPDTGHAFFNDTNTRAYNEDAARDAWEKSLAFLHKHLD